MNKTVFGVLVGGGLGLLDGLSAWMSPEARPMMTMIVIGSTIKGVLTGAAAGFVARVWGSLPLAISAGLGVGFVLSTVAAQGQPGLYWEIVLPGMLVGFLTGFITQRYPRDSRTGRRPRASAAIILCTLTGLPVLSASGQPTKPIDPLSSLAPLIGRWEGTSEGQPGKGSVSFDNARKRIVLRQFHVEGFVNQYVQDQVTSGDGLRFTTEAIENIPSGWRARETYTFVTADQIEEVFELAEPNKDFALYSRARLTRVR